MRLGAYLVVGSRRGRMEAVTVSEQEDGVSLTDALAQLRADEPY